MKVFANLLFLGILLWSMPHLSAQNCNQPISIGFSNRQTNSIQMNWINTNGTNASKWEIELRLRDEVPTRTANFIAETNPNILLTNLQSGTPYDVYIRTACTNGSFSPWNGPFQFTSVIASPSRCELNIPLRDNNCQNGFEQFFIQNDSMGRLGVDVFLNRVELIISHDWPADLSLTLISPNNKEVVLSEFNGIFTTNFGIPEADCVMPTVFSADACRGIKEGVPPFLGSFRPEGAVTDLYDGSEAAGAWRLRVCDNALNDRGILKFVNLVFSKVPCQSVNTYFIQNVTATSATIGWLPPPACGVLEIEYGPQGFVPGQGIETFFVPCENRSRTITGLQPDTDYCFFLKSNCIQSTSAPTCEICFRTTCANPTLSTSFNNQTICEQSCAIPCSINTPVWRNLTTSDELDWMVQRGKSINQNTGPDNDVSTNGNYVFVESRPTVCGPARTAILESNCILVTPSGSGCDMAFSYYMSGLGVGSLRLEISLDEGITWQSLVALEGSQADNWIRQELSLAEYQGLLAHFRFVATTTDQTQGDIALDQIEFYGSALSSEPIRYFVDADGDGYGNSTIFEDRCTSFAPGGFSRLSNDCDDTNPNIFPGAPEIFCNGIDENCSGLSDDQNLPDPIRIESFTASPTSCLGVTDGTIDISILGGTPPYQIRWSNGMEGSTLQELQEGFYRVTITDAGDCTYISPFIEVKSTAIINVLPQFLRRASCNGANDGGIEIAVNGGTAPYTFEWNDGSNSQNRADLSPGTYSVQVTDALGCQVNSAPITVLTQRNIQVGFTERRHVSCAERQDGRVTLAASGGRAPYTFQWPDGFVGAQRNNLAAGQYIISVVDADQCSQTYQLDITAPAATDITLTNLEQVRCPGERNGTIRVLVSGGTGPYTYFWNNGANAPLNPRLGAGDYTLTVVDANGCRSTSDTYQIQEPTPIIAEDIFIEPATCLLANNGSIALQISGGTPPLQYVWRNTMADSTVADQLTSGLYGVTVLDRRNCKLTIGNLFVPFLNKVADLNLAVDNQNKCADDRKANIQLEVSEVTLPINYNWSTGFSQTTEDTLSQLQDLPAGQYQVTITDGEGCVTTSEVITIPNISPISFMAQTPRVNRCAGDNDAALRIVPAGGTPPYSFVWSTGSTAALIENLSAGPYTCTITDANDCFLVTNEIFVFEPLAVSAAIITAPSNQGAPDGSIQVTPSGGVSPYSISWVQFPQFSGFTLPNLLPGVYNFKITDANGCEFSGSATIELSTSTNDGADISLSVYPNPTQGLLTIRGLQLQDYKSIQLADVLGRSYAELEIQEHDGDRIILSLHGLPAGIYTVVLIDGRGRFRTAKVIKSP